MATEEIEKMENSFIQEAMENFPEASAPYLRCVHWNYKEMKFLFEDEDGTIYHVDKEMLQKGFELFLKDLLDTGQMDEVDFDRLVQYSIFGRIEFE